MSIEDYKRFFNLTAVCSVNSPEETTSEVFEFEANKTSQKQVQFEIEEDMDCDVKPLFITVPQQGPFLEYYRNKEHTDFKINNYVVALFNSKQKQIAVYKELAANDFMSTLSITKGTLPKGRYTVLIQCSSFESATLHPDFCKGGLTIYKDNIQEPLFPDEEIDEENEEVEIENVQRKVKDECQEPSDFVKEIIEAGEPFTDSNFPPQQDSLSL